MLKRLPIKRNYWLTTHWPRLHNDGSRSRHVWLQEGLRNVADEMRTGDYVAVYEYQNGPPEFIDGQWHYRRPGRQKIIGHGEVVRIGRRRPHENRTLWRYGDIYPMQWIRFADLKIHGRGGVGREELNNILGYSLDYTLRGFGTKQSGLKKVIRGQFEQMIIE